MSTSDVYLMTIVAEAVLEERLTRDIEQCGASGWTATPCLGHSRDGTGAADFEGGNLRLDVLINGDRLEDLWQVITANYLDRYSVVAWSHPVRVQRTAKYGD